ncbi:MAG: protein kinase [Planctomycetes bacterium]|nr:protein kinase [Planctomycetota bacterium]
MEHAEGDASDREHRLNAAIAGWLRAAGNGALPDRAELLRQYPDFAADLDEFFGGYDLIRQFGGDLRPDAHPLEHRNRRDTPPRSSSVTGHREDRTQGPGIRPPRSFGAYELLEELGRGGMGVVFKARELRVGRLVALKMLRDVRLGSPTDVARFQNEIRAVARLDHPGLVPVYEAGELDGQTFYTMKLVDGGSLSSHVRRFVDSPRSAAAVVADLADAIHHAHQRGILHRDLKPSNILLDAEGRPHVTDFGLARAMDTTSELTGTGDTVGSPPYMAPEQAAGRQHSPTIATDVYGLGGILYSLLTGEPPFRGETPLATLRLVVQFDPPPPRSRNPRVDRDLEIICLKALSKEPERRYASAADLADDLRRYLRGETIRARVVPRRERAWRWMRRNPGWAAFATSILLAVTAGMSGLLLYSRNLADVNERLSNSLADAQRARNAALDARNEATAKEREAEELAYAATIRLAAKARDECDPRQMIELLNRVRPQPGKRDLRGSEWHYLWQQATAEGIRIAASSEPLYHVSYSPDGRLVACCGKDAIVRVYDGESHAAVLAFPTGQIETNCVAFSPDGRVLATTGDDGTVRLWELAEQERLRQGTSPREILRIAAHPGKAFQVIFNAYGETVFSCGDDPVIRSWDTSNGRLRGMLTGHTSKVEAIALSPDNSLLASAGESTFRLWSTGTSDPPAVVRWEDPCACVAFSPDGSLVAFGDNSRRVALAHVARLGNASDLVLASTDHRPDGFAAVAFSPDGRLLATADKAGNVAVWPLAADHHTGLLKIPEKDAPATDSVASPERVRVWNAHAERAYAVAFHPNGQTIASVGSDGALNFWRSAAEPRHRTMPGISRGITGLTSAPEPSDIAVLGYHQLRIYDPRTGQDRGELSTRAPWHELAVSADGRLLAAVLRERQLVVWDLSTWSELVRTRVGEGVDDAADLAFSPDGRHLAVRLAHDAEPVRLVQIETGRVVREFHSRGTLIRPAFSPDGQQLAVNLLNDVAVYSTATGAVVHTLRGHESSISSVVFSRDGRWLASSGSDRIVRVWDLNEGTLHRTLVGHRAAVKTTAFHPDGRSLVSGDEAGIVKVWHMATGHELCHLDSDTSAVHNLCFLGDGQHLVWEQNDHVHIHHFGGKPQSK